MAEATFNRELGATPAGITRFGQFRTDDGSNVTVDSYRSFAGDGSLGLADVYSLTYGSTGTATITLDPEAFGVSGVAIYKADGTLAGEVEAPKLSRRASASVSYSVSSSDTATVYVYRKGRSETEYRLQAAVV
jgi:hypothetical protein